MMGTFSELPPANTGQSTTETDPAEALFNASYVFGAPVYAIENEPGPLANVGVATPSTEDPPDVTSQPVDIPLQPQSHKTNSAWYPWPSGTTGIVVKLPNGAAIRALWFPVVPFPILVSPGHAPGSVMYAITTVGGELVPVPDGVEAVSLTFASPPAKWASIWVYVTGEKYPPFKAALNESISQPVAYDSLILADSTLLHYWPCNDAAGATQALDIAPVASPVNLDVLPGATLGASGFLPDGTTCAQSAGGSGAGLISHSPVGADNFNSIEFWFFPTNANCEICGDGGQNFDFLLSATSTLNVQFDFTQSNTNVVVSQNALHYFVATYNRGARIIDLYLDGSLAYTSANNGWGSNSALGFFYNLTSTSLEMTGKLAKIAIYSGVLSLAQVQQRFAAGLATA